MKKLWLSILSVAAVFSVDAKNCGEALQAETCGFTRHEYQCPIPAPVTCEYIPGKFCPAKYTPSSFQQATYEEGSVRRVVHCPKQDSCEVQKPCKRSCRRVRGCSKCNGGSCRYAGTRRHVKYETVKYVDQDGQEVSEAEAADMDIENDNE